MAYLTFSEYGVLRPNSDLIETDFDNYVEIAGAVIDRITNNKIIDFDGIDSFSEFTQERIKKSCAYQVDMIEAQGGEDSINGFAASNSGGFTLGRFSETANSGAAANGGAAVSTINSIPVSPMINIFMQPTGLLNRTINRTYQLSDFR